VGARRAAFVLVSALVLSACGFHLRGDVNYPPSMAVTFIEARDHYTPFYRKLKAALQRGGVQVTADAGSAGAIVRILEDETGQRVVSVSARNTPAEYEVFYVVRYGFEVSGREVLASQQLSRTRDYNYDETLVLGKAAESSEIRDALADDLVGVVTRRLSSIQ
jgi:LPS-assembly lipoprotein